MKLVIEGADIVADPGYQLEDGRKGRVRLEHEMTRRCEVVQNGACGTRLHWVYRYLRH